VRALVALDWNGTVVDDVERAAGATATVLMRRGLPAPGAERFRSVFRLPLSALFADLGVEDLTDAEREWNEAMLGGDVGLAAGIADALAELAARGHRLGVVSAAASEGILRDAGSLGVAGRFEFVHGGRADKVAALREVIAAAGVPVVYVGDTEYDMESAAAAGATTIGYGGGYRPASALRASGADIVIDSMVDLPGAVAALLTQR
jgi:phosphoglycolate phosphatase-like HAD superfamily hydrolase